MVQEYEYSLLIFSAALVMLMVSVVLWSWTQHNAPAAFCLTLISTGCLYLIYLSSHRVRRRFDIPPSKLVTGRFHGVNKGGDVKEQRQRRPNVHMSYQRLDEAPMEGGEQADSRDESAVCPDLTVKIHQRSASTVARAWRRQQSMRLGETEPLPTTPPQSTQTMAVPSPTVDVCGSALRRSEGLGALVDRAASSGEDVGGMIGLTAPEQQELLLLRRAEALGNLATQAASQQNAGGLIGLSVEEEIELQDFRLQQTVR